MKDLSLDARKNLFSLARFLGANGAENTSLTVLKRAAVGM